jgi:hypothetical protein
MGQGGVRASLGFSEIMPHHSWCGGEEAIPTFQGAAWRLTARRVWAAALASTYLVNDNWAGVAE